MKIERRNLNDITSEIRVEFTSSDEFIDYVAKHKIKSMFIWHRRNEHHQDYVVATIRCDKNKKWNAYINGHYEEIPLEGFVKNLLDKYHTVAFCYKGFRQEIDELAKS